MAEKSGDSELPPSEDSRMDPWLFLTSADGSGWRAESEGR